jgi:hypothetical protein
MAIKNVVWRDYDKMYSMVTINSITLRLIQTKENKNNRRWHGIIQNSIRNLIDTGMITGVYDIFHNKINFDEASAYEPFYIETELIKEGYFLVGQDTLDKLCNEIKSTKISKFALLRYYIAIQRTVNCDAQFGYLSQNHVTFINDGKTITQYNELLNGRFFLVENGYMTPNRRWNTTFFGIIGDEDNFESQVNARVKTLSLIRCDKEKVCLKTSETQKSNYSNNKPNSQTYNTVDEFEELFS